MKKTWALIPFFLILTASCSTFKKKPNSEPESTSSRPGITLVMGGLGVYGLTHAGILRVLEKEEIPIKSLIAFQTGAFVASLYAESENSFTTEWKASQMSLDKYYSSPHIFSETSQTSVQPFKNFIRSKIQTTAIENLKIPLTILATDLLTGDSISIQKGHLIQAILSSNAIPGFFSPVQWSTHRVLISPAFGREFDLSKDSEVLVFVDVKGKKADPPLEDQKDILFQVHHVLQKKWNEFYREKADVTLSVDLSNIAFDDFSKKSEVMYEGRSEALRHVEYLKSLLDL